MRDRTRTRPPIPARRILTAGALLVAVLAVAGCSGGTTPSPTSSASEGPSTPPSALPSEPSASATAGAPSPSAAPSVSMTQTDTEWGRIWDAVPSWFPILGAPIQADEPVSLAYELDTPPATVASMLQEDLELVALSTLALSGPLEDGGYVLDSAGEGTCRVESRILPLGTTTRVLVRYGADCPFG